MERTGSTTVTRMTAHGGGSGRTSTARWLTVDLRAMPGWSLMADRVAMTSLQYESVRVRDGWKCTRCGAPSSEGAWHHRRSKSVRDSMTHASCNGVWLCHDDHRWVHAHPFEARALGFIVSRFKSPLETPIKSAQYGWVLYDMDGRWASVEAPGPDGI